MLNQFDINHIKNAFALCEESQISLAARARIAYCKKLIAHAEDQKREKLEQSYADAIGTAASAILMGGIAADCERFGSE